MRVFVFLFATSLLHLGVASAQSFNIDMGVANPVPSSSFGAGAAQPGIWNQVGALPVNGSQTLFAIGGTPTGVTMTLTAGEPPILFTWDNTTISGNDKLLLEDGVDPGVNIPAVYRFSGLTAGTYQVYTYGWAPDSTVYRSSIVVNGGTPTIVGGAWPGNYAVPVTHALDTVTITAGQNITVSITDSVGFATFNGIQLKLTGGGPPIPTFCDGSGVGTACVACANNGIPGNGCANSSFPAGARLSASGNAGVSAGTDTLVLTCTNLTGPGLFFQAATLAPAPMPFGDGELCATGGIMRLGVVFPGSPSPANTAAYPGGITPNPIHTGGGPLVAGDIRHYQCWYRDSVAFCTAETSNLSQGITLTWGP